MSNLHYDLSSAIILYHLCPQFGLEWVCSKALCFVSSWRFTLLLLIIPTFWKWYWFVQRYVSIIYPTSTDTNGVDKIIKTPISVTRYNSISKMIIWLNQNLSKTFSPYTVHNILCMLHNTHLVFMGCSSFKWI